MNVAPIGSASASEMRAFRVRVIVVVGLAAVVLGGVFLRRPIFQDPRYHSFADQRVICGLHNFWNVVSNLPFALVAVLGLGALRSQSAFLETWERIAYGTLLAGVAFIAVGSGYYHLQPQDSTLFWDRLPMTIVFMSLLATTIGERISTNAGRLALSPLIGVGVASVLYWKLSGDLRFYGVVQFYPMVALPLMLILFRPRYSGTLGIWCMIGFYGAAKMFELFDHEIARTLTPGGHPLKHIAGALAMLCYVETIKHRSPLFY